tara:strand:+ start:1242 stop:1673 length:432 start_codon:yes stop_codon:yes gene_type:complete
MTRLYGTLLIIVILGVVGYFAYQYYVSSQKRIAILTSNNAKLETAQKQTAAEFEQYRANVKEEIEKFKAEIEKQQKLNNELNNNLEEVKSANKAITKLLANTDIIKNSLADPKASESRINEQVDLFFGAIDCATGAECVQQGN